MSVLTKTTIDSFCRLGKLLRIYTGAESSLEELPLARLRAAVNKACEVNPWFTETHVHTALKHWGELLTREGLEDWLAHYDIADKGSKRVALIMAGNIPMVGFHDLLAVVCTGNTALLKFSSKDAVLLREIIDYLLEIQPGLSEQIEIVSGNLKDFDAVIATGSNNTGRYFEYYFRDKPHIIRKNRTGVSILQGDESDEQLAALSDDIFLYFGLGCRNVSKIYLPQDMDVASLIPHWKSYAHFLNHHKYANNYHYHKSVWLMNNFAFTDGGFFLMRETDELFAPLATVYWERYSELDALYKRIAANEHNIQCVAGNVDLELAVPFGKAQTPSLSDYADRVDTVEFLLKT